MWRRKGFWVLAGIGALLLIVALRAGANDQTGSQAAATTTPVQSTALATTPSSSSTVAPTTTPPTTIPKVGVPRLVGMSLATAKRTLSKRGLHGSVTYKTTARYVAGMVISQSRKAGTSLTPGATVTLVVAKAPPPTTPPSTAPARNCDPAYPDACLHDGIGDYDCKGGSGNGPNYVEGPITVLPPDPFDLDRDGDGVGCEEG
jgi:PASTA domain